MLRTAMKLRGRSAAELRDRLSQATARWLGRHGIGEARELTGALLTEAIGSEDGGPVVRGPFFPSLDDRQATIRALHTIDPEFESKIRQRAGRILDGSYDLLGHVDVKVGSPVDWWVDPVAGVRAPDAHWSEIAYLDPAVVGDHKLVWELGRHRALVTLGQAAWCTGDQHYADACGGLLESWMDRNRPMQGLHWASSLEVAFRSMAWIWTLALLGARLPLATRRRATGYLAVSASHIERYLSTWFSPNTHLTGEALGLFVLGTALPQCRDAPRWRARGERILLEWLPRHVRSDGTYVEQSSWYHRYTADFYLAFLILAERSGLATREQVREPLTRLLEVLAWITRPDGSMPLIGDDDGGRLMFLDETPANITRGSLAVGAALLDRPDFAAAASLPTTELAWLLGADGLDRFQRLTPRAPDAVARGFPSGGLYVMRSGWNRSASVLTVDAGPHGFLNAGHAHADALSVDLTVQGRPLFIDPGTFTYTTSPAWRSYFRSTAAHNAATIDSRDSADVANAFAWATRCEARADVWAIHPDVIMFSGTHDGFMRRHAPPVGYRRSIVYLAPLLWIIRDEIDQGGMHDLAVHWQCAEGIAVQLADGEARLTYDTAPVANLWTLDQARIELTDGWVSPVYGRKVAAPHLAIRAGRDVPVVFTAIAVAGADVRLSVSGSDRRSVNVATEGGSGTIFFGGIDEVYAKSDARVGWVERDPASGAPVAVTVGGATSLSVLGDDVTLDTNGNGLWVVT